MKIFDDPDGSSFRYERGYPIGYMTYDIEPEDALDFEFIPSGAEVTGHYLFNHLSFVLLYHEDPASFTGSRIVGFEVEPFSVNHKYNGADDAPYAGQPLTSCQSNDRGNLIGFPQSVEEAGEIIFTYDVEWVQSDIKWSSRWALYLKQGPDDQIHWFSILNSTLIVFFLSGMVAMIMMRTLHKDIARYNEAYEKSLTEEETLEETGWKLVHADVFRPPIFSPMLLATFVGTGAQLLMMCLLLVIFALLGFLSPANRGGLLTALLLLFVFMGTFAGFVSARLYKMFGGKSWRRNTLLTATLFPGIVSSISFFVNFFVWHEHSTIAIPLTTMIAVLLLWFGISVPLVFAGAFFGYRKDKIEPPVATNTIPRFIPPQVWYMHPVIVNAVGGVLPFGAVFIEVFFILSAIWLHQIYYLFGFLFLVLIILIITCAEISIVLCYFKLVNENYEWWWQSIFSSGSSAIYLFLYSVVYFVTKLEIEKSVSSLLYFAYMIQLSFCFFLFTGCIGFFACLWFTRTIYASIKVD